MRPRRGTAIGAAVRTMGGAGGPPYNVFIGTVPYDATEERLRDMFSEVGPVHALRCAFPLVPAVVAVP